MEQLELGLNVRVQGKDDLKDVGTHLKNLNNEGATSHSMLKRLEESISQVVRNTKNMGDAFGIAGREAKNFAGKELAEAIGYSIKNPLEVAGNAVEKFVKTLGVGGLAVGAFGLAAVEVGKHVLETAKSFGTWAEEIKNFSARLGLSVEGSQAFIQVSKLAGVNAFALEASVRQLSMALSENGQESDRASTAMRRLGVNAYDAYGQLRPMDAILPELFKKLSSMPDVMQRNALATQILGRSAKELLPIMGNYDELMKKVQQTGVIVSAEQLEQAEKMKQQLELIEMRWEAIGNKIKGFTVSLADMILKVGSFLETPARVGERMRDMFDSPTLSLTGPNAAAGMGQQALGQQADERFRNLQRSMAVSRSNNAFSARSLGIPGLSANLEQQQLDEYDLKKMQEKMKDDFTNFGRTNPGIVAADQKDIEAQQMKLAVLKAQAEEMQKLKQLQHQVGEEGLTASQKVLRQWAEAISRPGANVSKLSDVYAQMYVNEGAKEFKARSEKVQTGMDKLNDNLPVWMKNQMDMFQGSTIFGGTSLPGLFTEQPNIFNAADIQKLGGIQQRIDQRQIANLQSQMGAQGKSFNASNRDPMSQINDTFNRALIVANAQYQLDLQWKERDDADSDFNKAITKAQDDKLGAIADLQKQQLDQARGVAGGLFDAMLGGGNSVSQFFKSQAVGLGRGAFENVAGPIINRGLNGVAGTLGPGLGKLLEGTLLGGRGGSPEIVSRDANTTAINTLTAAITGQAIGGVSAPGTGTGPSGTSSGLGGIFGKVFGSGSMGGGIFSAFGKGSSNASASSGDYSESSAPDAAQASGGSASSGSKALAGGISMAAAGVGLGMDMAHNLSMGGVAGGFGAASDILGMAAMIPGPQQPFIMAAAMVTGLVKSVFGNNPQKRQNQINSMLNNEKFMQPETINRVIDTMGNNVAYDSSGKPFSTSFQGYAASNPYDTKYKGTWYTVPGQVSTMVPPGAGTTLANQLATQGQSPFVAPPSVAGAYGGTNASQVNITVHALDSQSIVDRSADIGTAVHRELQKGGALASQIQSTILGG